MSLRNIDQKGFAKITTVILIVLFVGMVGYFVLAKSVFFVKSKGYNTWAECIEKTKVPCIYYFVGDLGHEWKPDLNSKEKCDSRDSCVPPDIVKMEAQLTDEIALFLLNDDLSHWGCLSEKSPGRYTSCTVNISKTSTYYTVIITYNGLYDDSATAKRIQATVMYQKGQWQKQDILKTQQCWLGRGHQDFSAEPCL